MVKKTQNQKWEFWVESFSEIPSVMINSNGLVINHHVHCTHAFRHHVLSITIFSKTGNTANSTQVQPFSMDHSYFVYKWMLNFIKCLLCIFEMIIYIFSLLIYELYWFSNAKPTLLCWDKPYLVLAHYHFYILLDLIC